MKNKKWFRKAVMEKPPYNLGGWMKNQSPDIRRRKALSSRPKNWKLMTKYLSVGRALQSLSNVTKDRQTKIKSKQDADYFFGKLKGGKKVLAVKIKH